MLGKKGIELSMNFIVILIISIVIFGFGVMFITRLTGEATDITKLSMDELDQRVSELICEGADRVCIGIDRKTIKRDEDIFFSMKIINVLDPQKFQITVSRPTPSGLTKNKQEIITDNLIWNPKSRDLFIDKNSEKTIGVGIQVPGRTAPGVYIFNIEIKQEDGTSYSNMQKIYVDVI